MVELMVFSIYIGRKCDVIDVERDNIGSCVVYVDVW
jgi:hypothetical protein